MTKQIQITAQGGTTFSVTLVDGDEREFLGRMEYGTLDADGQYEQDDDEIVEAAREQFDIDESVPAIVR